MGAEICPSVLTSTEFGLPNSLVRGMPPNTPADQTKKKMVYFLIFVAGAMFGGTVGVFTMCLVQAGSGRHR